VSMEFYADTFDLNFLVLLAGGKSLFLVAAIEL
jgi:hypothetical protein